MPEPRTFDQWRAALPQAYHAGLLPDGSAYFTCPMERRDEIDPGPIRALDPGIHADWGHTCNEDPCNYWMNIRIPAALVRAPTPLESAIAKLRAVHFTPEERAALRDWTAGGTPT